ncbi:MAG: SurA N-terminal domain-containing protein [Deltaproteobacteria bacterium]|nr:SurA N-terminal domain-containing protein [Deltaproteobacteria bacterium]
MRLWIGLSFLLPAIGGPLSAGEQGVLVDEVVAVVNKQVITHSEVREEALLILVERRGQAGLDREITPAFLAEVLDFLINQQVLLDEARRVELPPVSPDEVEQLLAGFRDRFSSREAYARFLLEHGLAESTISEVLMRHLRVERLKASKLRVVAPVTDEAVRQYYEKNRARFGGADIETVSGAIRHKLGQQTRDKVLARWIWDLRRRSEVKVLVDLDAPGGEEP